MRWAHLRKTSIHINTARSFLESFYAQKRNVGRKSEPGLLLETRFPNVCGRAAICCVFEFPPNFKLRHFYMYTTLGDDIWAGWMYDQHSNNQLSLYYQLLLYCNDLICWRQAQKRSQTKIELQLFLYKKLINVFYGNPRWHLSLSLYLSLYPFPIQACFYIL